MKEENVELNVESINSESDTTIVETSNGLKNGQEKCPKCGSTDISTNINTGKLRCNFCRHEFVPEKVDGLVKDIKELKGKVMSSGAKDIIADAKDVITLKCNSCGAEVVLDTSSALQARCHWCRNTLSINEQIPNGSVPDVILPFGITKDVAKAEIENFVGKRKYFAHPKFKEEFTTENVMGVYFPYMLVDVNAHSNLIGEGEHQTRKYYVGSGDKQEARYDADLYHVEREFDLTVHGLSVESNSERLNTASKTQTNNIINSIMPFDTENCVKYNANYLKGYTSEKRDTNIEQLNELVKLQSKDIARFAANETLANYDRGVCWSSESFDVKGEQWQAAYLPVWLYSYQQVKGSKKLLHYVAVNARTKETMGSVPIHMPKLIFMSILVEILGILGMISFDFDENWLVLLTGFVYYAIMYSRYRNSSARHTYEKDTKTNMTNLKKVDNFIKSKKGLTNSTMNGANNKRLDGKNATNKVFAHLSDKNILNNITDKNPLSNTIKEKLEKHDKE